MEMDDYEPETLEAKSIIDVEIVHREVLS
jgi:hypothetical protein